ncbi:MAG: DUF1844 domain-containing protein [Actinomycetia bacterium]|nr:DUF1844 domain-containing protein [Actinomycetes bacterium]
MAEESRDDETTGAKADEGAEKVDETTAGMSEAEMHEAGMSDAEMREAEMHEEAEMVARLQEEIRNLPVGEHLLYMMQSLSTLAVGRMGVTPETAALRDLDQARMAIDAFRALMEIVAPTRPAKEMVAHRGVLSQLQLAYVAALDRGPTGEGGAEADSLKAEPPAGREAQEAGGAEKPAE